MHDVHLALGLHTGCCCFDLERLLLELRHTPNKRNHDAWERFCVRILLQQICRGIENRLDLHVGELWTNDRQTTSAQPKHGVFLMHGLDVIDQVFHVGVSQFSRHVCVHLPGTWQELMQRRIEKADGDRAAIHRGHDFTEVGTLEISDLIQPLSSEDPATNDREAFRSKEHVLRARETNALRTQIFGTSCVGARVCVRQDLHGVSDFIRPAQDLTERSLHGDTARLDGDANDLSSIAIDGNLVTLLEHLPGTLDRHGLAVFVDVQLLTTAHAWFPPSASDDRSV
mmetsp:Transcript_10851/g.29945  ORF Transcript_10851/g.29945 Transcript_10851/m.29945 type:complete len:284 (-) Transcript_10851:772-1623(-)